MNSVFYIIGIVFSFVSIIVSAYYIDAVESAYALELLNTINPYDPYGMSYNTFDHYASIASDLTAEAALISLFFFLYFVAMEILGLMRVKTKTTRVMSIIGISLGGIFTLWALLVMSNPGAMGLDEVGPAFVLYGLIALAFSITGLVQSTRYARRKTAVGSSSKDLLDS